jgi:flavin-dependent dehydrogenase
MRHYTRGDLDGITKLHADDFRRVDHRRLGWDDTGKGDERRLIESFFAAAIDRWWQVDEVLACDDRVIALTCTMHGRSNDGGGGGAFAIPFGVVFVVEYGLRTHEHHYQPEDRRAMLAQFAELSRDL